MREAWSSFRVIHRWRPQHEGIDELGAAFLERARQQHRGERVLELEFDRQTNFGAAIGERLERPQTVEQSKRALDERKAHARRLLEHIAGRELLAHARSDHFELADDAVRLALQYFCRDDPRHEFRIAL